jgi:osmotically-inducible protein OsmY
MTSDPQTQSNVLEELSWDPVINPGHLLVDVKDGSVVLRGNVRDYAQKWHAGQAAERAFGALSVENQIEVLLDVSHECTDTLLEKSVKTSLKWISQLPNSRIGVIVSQGEVILNGALRWEFQKQAATRSLLNVTGIRNLQNDIGVSSERQTTHPYAISTYAFDKDGAGRSVTLRKVSRFNSEMYL